MRFQVLAIVQLLRYQLERRYAKLAAKNTTVLLGQQAVAKSYSVISRAPLKLMQAFIAIKQQHIILLIYSNGRRWRWS